MSCAADSTVIETKVLYMVFLDTDDFELKHSCFLYNSLLLEMRRAYFLLNNLQKDQGEVIANVVLLASDVLRQEKHTVQKKEVFHQRFLQ